MKKTLSFTLCILLLFSFSILAVNGATPAEQAGDYLKQIGIYEGYEDGSLRLERNITRTEFAVLAVRLIDKVSEEPTNRGKTVFRDVPSSFWGSGYINIAVANGLLVGDAGTNLFRPQGQITYAEATTVLVRLLGYEEAVVGSDWPTNFMNKAQDLNLTKNINIKPNDPISRGDIAVLIYNALEVTMGK